MSTIVRTPRKSPGRSKYCRGKTCRYNMKYVDADYDSRRGIYRINTVIRCDDCDQLWVVRPHPAFLVFYIQYLKVRKLHWYHYAKYKIPKEVQA